MQFMAVTWARVFTEVKANRKAPAEMAESNVGQSRVCLEEDNKLIETRLTAEGHRSPSSRNEAPPTGNLPFDESGGHERSRKSAEGLTVGDGSVRKRMSVASKRGSKRRVGRTEQIQSKLRW